MNNFLLFSNCFSISDNFKIRSSNNFRINVTNKLHSVPISCRHYNISYK